MKRKEEIGSPYLSPLSILKGAVGVPLIIIEIEAVMTHHIIHLLILLPSPTYLSICSKKLHLIESYAFLKSILNKASYLFFFLSHQRASLTFKTPSTMLLCCRKPVCVTLIISGMIGFNIRAKILEMILYRHPTIFMGL